MEADVELAEVALPVVFVAAYTVIEPPMSPTVITVPNKVFKIGFNVFAS